MVLMSKAAACLSPRFVVHNVRDDTAMFLAANTTKAARKRKCLLPFFFPA